MLLMIDNYDSFTYNLVQYFGQLDQEVKVFRSDKVAIQQIEMLNPGYLVISPGPCTPNEAGISVESVRYFAGKLPILGICLGHQSIGQAFGAKVVHAKQVMHGKVSNITHTQTGLFRNISNPFEATRYHSLALEKQTIPDCFSVTAWTEDEEIMAIQHNQYAIQGVQFHPESIATQYGHDLLQNFLNQSD